MVLMICRRRSRVTWARLSNNSTLGAALQRWTLPLTSNFYFLLSVFNFSQTRLLCGHDEGVFDGFLRWARSEATPGFIGGQWGWAKISAFFTFHSTQSLSHDFTLVIEAALLNHPANELLAFFRQRKSYEFMLCQLMALSQVCENAGG